MSAAVLDPMTLSVISVVGWVLSAALLVAGWLELPIVLYLSPWAAPLPVVFAGALVLLAAIASHPDTRWPAEWGLERLVWGRMRLGPRTVLRDAPGWSLAIAAASLAVALGVLEVELARRGLFPGRDLPGQEAWQLLSSWALGIWSCAVAVAESARRRTAAQLNA